ncbi:unnamed protein product [Penicillium pancosmium]
MSLGKQDSAIWDTSNFAMASVHASENIIALCEAMDRQNFLKGDLWPVIHMLTSSILTILYFVVASRASRETHSLLESLASGFKILRCLAKHNYLANRGKVMLTIIISTLPGNLRIIQERVLDSGAKEPYESQSDSHPRDAYKFGDAYTSHLASKTFLLSPTTSPGGSNPVNATRGREAEPGKSLSPSANENQQDSKVQSSQSLAVPPFQQDLVGTSEYCKGHISSKVSNDLALMGKDQNYLGNQNWEPVGDACGFLQAQPLALQQDCIDDSWFGALKLANLGDSGDYESSVSRLEDSGLSFDFNSWL